MRTSKSSLDWEGDDTESKTTKQNQPMKSTLLLALLYITTISSYCQIYTPEVKVQQTPNGNVGIGTDTPDSELTVNSGSEPIISKFETSSSENTRIEVVNTLGQINLGLGAQPLTNGFGYLWSSTGNMMLGSDGSPSFVIRGMNNGKIGIGTTDPTYRLEIVGTEASMRFRQASEQSAFGLIIRQNPDLSGLITAEGRDLNIGFGWDKKLFLGVSQHSQYNGQVIIPGANVGIATSTPTYKLDVNGSIRYTSGGLNGSDRRWKKDIASITSASATLNKVKPVSYKWRIEEFPDKNFDERKHYGFIAQELEEILPDLVDTDNEGYKSVDYIGLIGILVQGFQEKELEIEKLKSELKQNQSVLQTLASRLDRLEGTSIASKNIND